MRHQIRLLPRLLVGAFVLSCSSSNEHATRDIGLLSRDLMVELPKGAHVVGVEWQHGLDDMTRVKVVLSRHDFELLLPRLPMARDAFARGKGRLGSDSGFWNPGATPGIRSAQAVLPEGRALHVGYAASSSDTFVVFIVNHGT
jgi:hypothetical protein